MVINVIIFRYIILYSDILGLLLYFNGSHSGMISKLISIVTHAQIFLSLVNFLFFINFTSTRAYYVKKYYSSSNKRLLIKDLSLVLYVNAEFRALCSKCPSCGFKSDKNLYCPRAIYPRCDLWQG